MTTDGTSSTTRRRIIKTGVAAGVGGAATVVVASPASAATGDPVILGTINNADAETVLVGGSSANPALALQGGPGMAPLQLTSEVDAELPPDVATGSLALTTAGDMVIGGKANTKAYVNTSRWANRTLAIAPKRILDTRSMATYSANVVTGAGNVLSGKLGAGKIIHVTVKNVPPALAEKATAAYVNITVAGTVSGGFLTAYSSSIAKPGTSSLNWWGPNQVLSNLVEVQLGSYNGTPLSFGIYVHSATSVIVDVCGLILSNPGTY